MSPPVPRPEASREVLDRLLAVGTEAPHLDYKRTIDLDQLSDIVEITKDIGAMMVRGGHIVIGADDSGSVVTGAGIPPGQRAKFDEANLRGKLKRYLGTEFDMYTAIHDVGGVHVGVVHVPAHPRGFLPFQADGAYPDPKDPSKQKVAFREGDIYIRRGTASTRANHAEITRLIEEASSRSRSPVLSWEADDASFEASVAAAFTNGDDVALRRFLERVGADGSRMIGEPATTVDQLIEVFDRLTCLAALALRWGRPEWVEPAVATLVKLYRCAITDRGSLRHDLGVPAHRVMAAIINRVVGLGALAVAGRHWTLIPTLVIQRPDAEPFRSGHYTNWIRQTTTEASRAGALEHTDLLGRTIRISFLEQALLDVGALECVNLDAPSTDRFRDLVVQFDALATMAVWGLVPGNGDHPYYPWHRAYEPNRYEPAIVMLLTDGELRRAIFPGDDRVLAALLRHLEEFSRSEFARFDGGWPYMAPVIRGFLDRHAP